MAAIFGEWNINLLKLGKAYMYLMSLYFKFCFALFVKNSKIEYDLEEKIFGKMERVVCLDTLWVKNFDETFLECVLQGLNRGGIHSP